jgi:formylglycine-generating enzyme required for sulfatase activity
MDGQKPREAGLIGFVFAEKQDIIRLNLAIAENVSFMSKRFRMCPLLVLMLALLLVSATTPQGYSQTPAVLSLQLYPGYARLQLTGEVGIAYAIQCANNLTSSTQWVYLTNLMVPTKASLDIRTTNSAVSRFYRAVRLLPSTFHWIPPGTFIMGSPDTDLDRDFDEGPQTRVTLTRGFWISKFETTQAEYADVTGEYPSNHAPPFFDTDDPRRPVEEVTWEDAVRYCTMLTARERQAGRIGSSLAYRLPTEAEWEYACRSGTTTRYGYGDDPGYSGLTNYAWYGFGSTHPVGQKLPNSWGLYDMHGNVLEYCSDWYSPSYAGGSVVDPIGPPTGSERVIRGGSYYSAAWLCRCAQRKKTIQGPGGQACYTGFRVVLSANP